MDKQYWTLAELQEIKEQLLQSFQFKFEAIIVHKKIKILTANQTAGLLFGYEMAEINGKTIMDLVTPEVRSLVLMHILQKYQNPYEAIRKAVIFASFKIGATSAADGFLDPSELEALYMKVAG